jgi:translation initiation factor 1
MKANQGSPVAKIRVEKRCGKAVTVIAGLHTYGTKRLEDMASRLKSEFGTGGTVKNGVIEIQGERADAVREWLKTTNMGRI